MMIKTDCFAYTKKTSYRHPNGKCKITKGSELICENKNCTLYKSFKQYSADCEKYGDKEKAAIAKGQLMYDIDGELLKELLKRRKIKFINFAAQIGVSIDSLQYAFRNGRASGELLHAAAKELDLPVEALRRE